MDAFECIFISLYFMRVCCMHIFAGRDVKRLEICFLWLDLRYINTRIIIIIIIITRQGNELEPTVSVVSV